MRDAKIYLLGASGHSLSILDALESNDLSPEGYFDAQVSSKLDLPYMGKESVEKFQTITANNEAVFFPCVGDNRIRQFLTEFILTNSQIPFTVVHSGTSISKTVSIGSYTFVGAGAVVNSKVEIGIGTIINTGAIIEHECCIGNFVHIGPGAVLCGDVSVGERSFIGANATIKQGIRIGRDVVVGAGAVVLNDVPDSKIVAGNPAKFLK